MLDTGRGLHSPFAMDVFLKMSSSNPAFLFVPVLKRNGAGVVPLLLPVPPGVPSGESVRCAGGVISSPASLVGLN